MLTEHVLMAMRAAGEPLGSALQRPGMLAASAAWDADAVPTLCILALGLDRVFPREASPDPSHVRWLLRPATTECLRSVQISAIERCTSKIVCFT